MSFTEKIDVLDLLIDTIKDHEKKLDSLIYEFEKIARSIDSFRGESELGNCSPSCEPALVNLLNMEDY